MRALFLGITTLFLSISAAYADDIMANYYGNTLIAKTATSELHIHYLADHTFNASGHGASGPIALQGKWFLDDKGRLCRNYDPPLPGTPNPVCTAWASHAVGETWTVMQNVTLTLVQGIQ